MSRPALYISHAFNPSSIPEAKSISIIYQNVLTQATTTSARGTLQQLVLDAEITFEPGAMYQVSVDVNHRDYSAIITAPPGRYARGSVITTDADEPIALNGEPDRIEDARLNDELLRQVVRRMRSRHKSIERPLLALDWESAWLERVRNSSHPGHREAVLEGARAIDIAREEWPDAAISFYGCPWGTRSPSEDWFAAVASDLKPILDRVDWLGPSIYDKIKDSESNDRMIERGRNMHDSAIKLALRVANGRPILAWVAHRYLQPAMPYNNELIEEHEFRQHIRWAWNLTDFGERIDGFVLWYRDRENWERLGLPPQRNIPNSDNESALTEIERRYGQWLIETMELTR